MIETPAAGQIMRRADSSWIGCGILFVILFFVAGSLAPESPLQTSSDQLFLDYYANNYDAHLLATSISVISLLFFVVYISGLCQAFRRLMGRNALLPTVLYSMGLLATGLMVLAQACVSIEARIAHYKGSGAVIRGIDELGHVSAHLFSYPAGVFMLLTAVGTYQTRLTARWISVWAGLLSLSLLATAGTFEAQHPLHTVGVLTLMLFTLWLVVSGLHMLSRLLRQRPQLI
jgi:hypothetical protein